jgi:hypothetical protein
VFILWQWRWYNLTLILSPLMVDLVSTLLKHTVKKTNMIKSQFVDWWEVGHVGRHCRPNIQSGR